MSKRYRFKKQFYLPNNTYFTIGTTLVFNSDEGCYVPSDASYYSWTNRFAEGFVEGNTDLFEIIEDTPEAKQEGIESLKLGCDYAPDSLTSTDNTEYGFSNNTIQIVDKLNQVIREVNRLSKLIKKKG